ncbi:MAG: 5'-deoxyadenosine deaminase [Candidatus Methanofastidiosia archaeon]
METTLLKNGIVVTQNDKRDIFRGDILIKEKTIAEVGEVREKADNIFDCKGKIIVPGFVQTHVHMNQTLFRCQADDLSLIDWLEKKIFLLESAHDKKSVYWSGMLSCAEMLGGGVTCVVDMETVNHTEEGIKAIADCGIRGFSGKLMMDKSDSAPSYLIEDTETSIHKSLSLMKRWHNSHEERIKYVFTPRFALSCTKELLAKIAELSKKHSVLVHTHASENKKEVELVKKEHGVGNIEYLEKTGLLFSNLLLAHCIWINNREMELLRKSKTNVLHCPTANLKLASGIASVPEMLDMGINVSLGSDGAACNNNLDIFLEMRICALIHKIRKYDPSVLPAQVALDMATRNGARAVGLENIIGVIKKGAKADIAVIGANKAHIAPLNNPVSAIVYSARSGDVDMTFVDGKLVYNNNLLTANEEDIIAKCIEQRDLLLDRVKEIRY